MSTADCYRDSLDSKNTALSESIILKNKVNSEGIDRLTDGELLTLFLSFNFKNRNISVLVHKLLYEIDKTDKIPSIKQLVNETDIPESIAYNIVALFEFTRRKWRSSTRIILNPEHIYNAIRHFCDRKQERFICITFNAADEIINTRVITIGIINKTVIHPREVFADAIADRAYGIICAHSHNGLNVQPSVEDNEVTKQLQDSSKIVGIHLIDHIIFNTTTFYSYRQEGNLVTHD
jgi:DNA repair protein RadC